MNTKASPLSDFYKQEKFNPTFIDVNDDNKLWGHYLKRLNLYTNKLKLTPALFNNALCLEFGCSSGENSLMMASLGAKFEFVEPQLDSIKRLEALFQDNGFRQNIIKIHNDIIENHNNDLNKFDFVIAEGFLHYVPTKNEQLRKILGYLKPTGQCLISTADPYGQFIQLFKVFIFKYLQNKGQYAEDRQKMDLAHKLFDEEYRSIPHSRPFEMYVKDTFYNPYIGRKKYWGVEEILPVVMESGFILRASWPYYGYNDDLLWHKHVQEDKDLMAQSLKRYYMKVPSYIAGEELINHSEQWAEAFVGLVKKLMDRIEDYYDSGFDGELDYSIIENIVSHLQQVYHNNQTIKLFQEVGDLFKSLFTCEEGEFISRYRISTLPKLWGVSYHYMCFSRNYASKAFLKEVLDK